jgi:hypothetical protein
MRITIRYFDGCPHWQMADARLREVLASKSLDPRIEHELVSTPEEAERLRFPGSPTILIDGVDPFPAEEAGFGLTCRVYRTPAGQEGSPSVEQILAALP